MTIDSPANAVRSRFPSWAVMGLAAVACAVAAAMPAPAAAKAKQKPMLMFVQAAETVKIDESAKTIRLVNVSPQTIYFADRPVRVAGHITLDNYMKEWTAKAGKDNFSKDPPNAALSVYEPGQPDSTLAVVEIRNPRIEGKDLVYSYNVIKGKLPASGGQTSLFIDWIGVGGGVGVGFHGVGVGYRGPGWR
jgi:hypothetical protein